MSIDLTLYQGHDDYEIKDDSTNVFRRSMKSHVKGMKSISSHVKLTPLEQLLDYCGHAEPDRRLHAMACYLLEHQAAHLSIDFKIFNHFYDIMKTSFAKPKDKPCYLLSKFGEKYAKEFLLALSNARSNFLGEEFESIKGEMCAYIDKLLNNVEEVRRVQNEIKDAEKQRHKSLESELRKAI